MLSNFVWSAQLPLEPYPQPTSSWNLNFIDSWIFLTNRFFPQVQFTSLESRLNQFLFTKSKLIKHVSPKAAQAQLGINFLTIGFHTTNRNAPPWGTWLRALNQWRKGKEGPGRIQTHNLWIMRHVLYRCATAAADPKLNSKSHTRAGARHFFDFVLKHRCTKIDHGVNFLPTWHQSDHGGPIRSDQIRPCLFLNYRFIGFIVLRSNWPRISISRNKTTNKEKTEGPEFD